MPNETKITSIVDEKTLTDLEKLNARINLIIQTYQNAVKEIGSGLKIKVDGVVDYSDKLQKLTAAMEKVASGDSMLKEAKKEQEILLKRLSEQMKENVKDVMESAKADKIAEQAALAAAKTETERLKQQKLLNQESKKRKISIQEAETVIQTEVKTISEATEQNRKLRIAVKSVDVTTEEGRKTVQQMNIAIEKNTEFIRRNSDAFVKQKMTIGDYKEQVKAALVELKNGEKGFRNIGIIAKGFGGILKESVSPAVNEIKVGVSSMIRGWVGAQAILSGIQKLIGLFKSGMQSVIDFEASNSNLAAILGTTSKGIKELTDDAKRLGAATKYTASEATGLQIELAKLGFSRKEILESTEYILRFAQATGSSLPDAASLAGASLRMFGADTKETERYVSAMAVATNKSALSFSYLQTAMPIVGPVAKAFNFQIEDTLALLGKLSDAGFDASMAATATRNILLNLADGSGKLATALGKPVDNLPDLVTGLQELRDKGIDLNTTLELTDKRSVAAFNAFLTAADGIVPLRDQITGVGDELKNMANVMADNVKGELAGLSSAWESFMITLGKNTGTIAGMVRELTDLVRWMREVASTAEELGEERMVNAKRVGEEAAKEDKLWVQSKKSSLDKAASYEHNRGLDWNAAFEKSREQQLKILERALLHEEARLQLYTKRNQKQWGEYNNRNFLKQGLGLQKTTNEMKKGMDESFSLMEQQTSYIASLKVKIEQVKDIANNYQDETQTDKFETPLSDKEKAAQEKAAKEQLKIRETYQQSELDLMDEGLKKELAKIALDYTKKMAAVKGNSKEEISTRENLAKEMQQSIEDKTVSYVIAKEQKDIANKLEAVKKGSQEEFDLRIEQLELQRDIETKEAIKTGEDISIIDKKYNANRLELIEKFSSERMKKMLDEYAMRSVVMNQAMQNELASLVKQYSDGEIKKEDFERRKSDITAKYGIKQAEAAVELAKKQLGIANLSAEDEESLKKKLADAEIALSNAVMNVEVANAEKTADAHKKKMEKVAESIQMVGDLLNSFADLGSALFDRKIQEVEEEQDANDEAGEREVERIDKLAENGVITTEEAEARKRAAAAATAVKETELAKKKADLQTKQAKMDKANAVVQSIINTATAVMKVWGQTGIGGFALAPIVAAIGAIQLATIIAQPIPKYAKGTDNHPGGPAVVGDGGRHEAVVIGSKYFITPDTSTLLDLPRGAKVIPDIEKEMLDLRRISVQSDAMLLYNSKRNDGSRVTVNNDYSDLKKEMQTTNRLLSNIGNRRKRINNYQSFNDFVNRKI